LTHLVFDGSIDARMAKTLIEKQAVIDQSLDKEKQPQAEVEGVSINTSDERDSSIADSATDAVSAVRSTPRWKQRIAEIAERLTGDDVAFVHAALKKLAALDKDRALARNNVGFSRYDSTIGHSLAESDSLTPRQAAMGLLLLKKYHRQLDSADSARINTLIEGTREQQFEQQPQQQQTQTQTTTKKRARDVEIDF
jgi:hypothetical protein